MSNCNCETCQYTEAFNNHLQMIPKEQHEFFSDLYEGYLDKCMSLDFANAVIDGTWPIANEIITLSRKRTGIPFSIVEKVED
jgi:hypothetical protein